MICSTRETFLNKIDFKYNLEECVFTQTKETKKIKIPIKWKGKAYKVKLIEDKSINWSEAAVSDRMHRLAILMHFYNMGKKNSLHYWPKADTILRSPSKSDQPKKRSFEPKKKKPDQDTLAYEHKLQRTKLARKKWNKLLGTSSESLEETISIIRKDSIPATALSQYRVKKFSKASETNKASSNFLDPFSLFGKYSLQLILLVKYIFSKVMAKILPSKAEKELPPSKSEPAKHTVSPSPPLPRYPRYPRYDSSYTLQPESIERILARHKQDLASI